MATHPAEDARARLTSLFRKRDPDGVYDIPAFRRLLRKECCRSDRNSHGFYLVVYDVGAAAPAKRQDSRLIQLLQQEIRLVDEIGRLDSSLIGVLLPEITETGAERFVARMHCALSTQGLDVPHRRLAYPCPSDPGPGTQASGCRRHVEDFLQEPAPPWKRATDRAGGALCLLLLAPLMLFVAILIKLVSPGPVLFRQRRVGYMGRLFDCWKFRTMRVDADESCHHEHVRALMRSGGAMQKLDSGHDPRLIPCGRLMRAAGIDELPQLVNVLKGDMSLIGPRPCIPYEYQCYSRWQRQRVAALPGLTGLWQVNGKNRTSFEQMVRYDIAYSRRLSLLTDFRIILRTFPAIWSQVQETLSKGAARDTGADRTHCAQRDRDPVALLLDVSDAGMQESIRRRAVKKADGRTRRALTGWQHDPTPKAKGEDGKKTGPVEQGTELQDIQVQRFVYCGRPHAQEVYLTGDFNGWHPTALPMSKSAGAFVARVELNRGEHQYKFLVDGEWQTDPAAESQVPNGLGSLNSVVRVKTVSAVGS